MFSLDTRPGFARLLFAGQPILEAVSEHLVFRTFRLSHMVMRPQGPVAVASLPTSCLYGHDLLAATLSGKSVGPLAFDLTITPTRFERPLDRLVTESRTVRVTFLPDKGRFRWDWCCDLQFHADITGGEGLQLTPMAQWPGDDYAIIEFDDPLLSGGVGPQVPMTQDWVGLLEPELYADGFVTAWRKRFHSVICQTARDGWRRLAFNRILNGVQQYYNRHMLRCAPCAPYYYQQDDGRWLRVTPNFAHPSGHHICEWGYDMHLYALLPKASAQTLFAAGQQVTLSWSYEEVDADELPEEVRQAPEAISEPAELALADRPIYEEPVCQFTRSTLTSPDQYGWLAHGSDCQWQRSGGYGGGALTFAGGSGERAWRFPHWGPSYATNPVPPRSRYALSAWVRTTEPEALCLAFTHTQFNGPTPFATRQDQRTEQAASAAFTGRQEGDWREVRILCEPTGNYCITGAIGLHYHGQSPAAISAVSLTRL